MDALEAAFRDVLAPLGRGADSPTQECLGDRLRAIVTRARAAHPELAMRDETFIRCLATAVGATRCEPEALVIADLYLACACAQGTPGAAARFEARYAPVIRRAVARVLSGAAQRDEAVQRARLALLVGGGDGSPAKISQYLGQGALESWVAVAAIRLAVSLGRSESAERRVRDLAVDETVGRVDPEALFIKSEVRRELEEAVQQALERLEAR